MRSVPSSRGPGLREKAAYALSSARGVPIEWDLGVYRRIVHEIRAIDLSARTTEELARGAAEARDRLRAGADPDRELPLVFALAAEASARFLGLRPFDEQLVAAIALHRGRLTQMQTGEGKTLAAALAACLRGMGGGGVHVLTANDYLARRDAAWMRPLYNRMGLEVAAVGAATNADGRRRAYAADVTYCTAREAGFDYLRDGLRHDATGAVHRGFGMAIVDEADFILIDEARVPLVIAGAGADDSVDPVQADAAARLMAPGTDYTVDREGRRISILLPGHARIEAALGVEGIHEERGARGFARVYAALHARELLCRGVDYVVKDGAIALVDEFTGRIADRRQWPWGVQAALEAKEGLAIRPEGRVYGSITVDHLIGLYRSVAAMTATAVPSAEELWECYGLPITVIPTVKPAARTDEPDVVFADRARKMDALAAEITAAHVRGRPVLVGTGSVLESTELAGRLRAAGVECAVLNAECDEAEAECIAAAGRYGAVTISTNMAGRGTDIRLADDPRVFAAGGLYVIGANRHESRRVDDQLRGRAGRQGEPGGSRFFLSLEDPLFVRYGVREFLSLGGAAPVPGRAGPLDDPVALREIDRAQSIIAAQHHAARRNLRKYTRLVELDRRRVRGLRDQALGGGALPEEIEEALEGAEHGARTAGGADPAARGQAVEAFLCALDRFWADHLLFVEDVREGVPLERYAGREPGLAYIQRVGQAFEDGLEGVIREVADACARLPDEPDALRAVRDQAGAPSSTWTYQVDDEGPARFNVGAFASAGAGAAAIMAGPLLLLQAAAALVRFIVRRLRKG
jgi:preprotein translocase subunit SecA